MKTLSLLFCSCFFYTLAFAQTSNLPPNPQPGKCYAKCLIATDNSAAPKFKEKTKSYPVYTGSTPEQVKLEKVAVVVEPASTKWTEKGEGKNKKWCLVEIPAVMETLMIVKNTKETEDYEMRTITTRKAVKQQASTNRKTEWKEVVCNEKINKKMVSKIQNNLAAKDFYKGLISGKLDTETKTALTAFQKANNLPIGNLDKETMSALNISYR